MNEQASPAPRIVVGVDGSDGGRRALRWALREAKAAGARLLVVSVYFRSQSDPAFPPSAATVDLQRRAERLLREDLSAALAELDSPPEVETAIVPAAVTAHALAEAAADAELLVVGSHGHGAIESRLLGTVSQGCVSGAICPVVVIPVFDRSPSDATTTAVTAPA